MSAVLNRKETRLQINVRCTLFSLIKVWKRVNTASYLLTRKATAQVKRFTYVVYNNSIPTVHLKKAPATKTNQVMLFWNYSLCNQTFFVALSFFSIGMELKSQ
jgi:hypothetical protein